VFAGERAGSAIPCWECCGSAWEKKEEAACFGKMVCLPWLSRVQGSLSELLMIALKKTVSSEVDQAVPGNPWRSLERARRHEEEWKRSRTSLT
jgi:hypothetical protein